MSSERRESAPGAEPKRSRWWRPRSFIGRVLIGLLILFTLFLLVSLRGASHEASSFGGNVVVLFLVNFNIIILCVLIYVVGRNIIRLIFDRRRGILGAKLRAKLVVALVGLTLVPTIFLFILASGLLNRAIEGWFSSQVDAAVDATVVVSQRHFALLKQSVSEGAQELIEKIEGQEKGLQNQENIEDFLESFRQRRGFFSVSWYSDVNHLVYEVHHATAMIENFREPIPDRRALNTAFRGTMQLLSEDQEANQFIRAYTPLNWKGKRVAVILTRRIDPELAEAFSVVNDSYADYGQLKLFRYPLKSGYLLTLALVTGMILFGAMWLAFYIARQIVGPIEKLVFGTREIARGNYDFRIADRGDDEIGLLVSSFNTMASDLTSSRQDAEQRRLLIEAIVTNLAVGVISLDRESRITSMNVAARRIYPTDGEALGVELASILMPAEYEKIEPLLQEVPDSASVIDKEISVDAHGRELRIICTAGRIINRQGEWIGTLLLLDDITELHQAQQMSAWREVARRIAHEIKNPLTPIQLSAQRLKRILEGKDLGDIVAECTDTIVENVGSIKRLANEFSHFARMPTAVFQPTDLNMIISDTLSSLADGYPDITFQFIADDRVPMATVDGEQIRRALWNLINNAAQAIDGENQKEQGRVDIRSYYDRRSRAATIEIADNGPGISETDRGRIFDPYFTTKKGGTGLGLAVVSTIVSDHHGQVRVYENIPRGAKFILDLPLIRKPVTQRRLEVE